MSNTCSLVSADCSVRNVNLRSPADLHLERVPAPQNAGDCDTPVANDARQRHSDAPF